MAADASAFSSSSRSNFSLSEEAEEYSEGVSEVVAPISQSSTLTAGVRLPVRGDVWSPTPFRLQVSK